MNQPADRWDRVLAFHKSRASLVVFGLAVVLVAFWENSAWAVSLKVGILIVAACYWVAVGVKSVQGFRAGYRDPDLPHRCTDARSC